jgi:hypothetical protein
VPATQSHEQLGENGKTSLDANEVQIVHPLGKTSIMSLIISKIGVTAD